MTQTLQPTDDELFYFLALHMIPGIGPALAKTLISYHHTARQVFQTKISALSTTPGIGRVLAERIQNFLKDHGRQVEKEYNYLKKNNIQILAFYSPDFPSRLKNIPSSPSILFYKGNINLNDFHLVAIVGTRKATPYGSLVTKKIVEDLKKYNVCIVSGLAYGIDVIAHKAALEHGIPTLAVLAHGLDRIYPPLHTPVAKEISASGGLLTEYFQGSKPDKENFPVRNRIVAGMCEAVIVVEAADSGGALITADFARSYRREVFAVPGRLGDVYSEGTNQLIKQGEAHLFTDADDLANMLHWHLPGREQRPKIIQADLFPHLTDAEAEIYQLLKSTEKVHIDQIMMQTDLPLSKLLSMLTEMELKGAIISLPGKVFQAL